ncbi:MAG: NUDIX hydrolase [Bryobacterales bacterium]|nr:NUDIX hydrolase [Bryobacterales bacterium]
MLAETIRFVEAHDRAFDPAFPPGHITGSAWIVSGDAVLLTHHRKLDKWFQLGGHLEPGETAADGALREAREESGLAHVEGPLADGCVFDVDVHLIPARGEMPAHYHYDVRFLFSADAAAPLVISAESHTLAWVPLVAAARYNDSESILRMVRKTQAKN